LKPIVIPWVKKILFFFLFELLLLLKRVGIGSLLDFIVNARVCMEETISYLLSADGRDVIGKRLLGTKNHGNCACSIPAGDYLHDFHCLTYNRNLNVVGLARTYRSS
jgi:hypothetical protein